MQFHKTTLANKLRLITIPMPDNPAVTVFVMVEAGSKYETKANNGISHFLEHMVFKGTTKRPKASDISRELDSIGAHYNAFTSQEFTGYYAKADKKHLNTILDIISDLYTDPIFDEKEMQKEKGVIVEEIRMYNDLPQRKVMDEFLSLLYSDQPAGWNIAGTEDSVRSFTREQLVKYRNEHYVSGATTIVVAGSFDENKIKDKVEKYFSNISNSAKSPKLSVVETQNKPMSHSLFKETDQTHLVIGFRTFPIKDDRIATVQVLATILGRGMSSRLFTKMRDELGICYYVKADHDAMTDHGVLSIVAGVDNTRVEQAIAGILEECKRFKQDLVPADELKKAKDYIAGTTFLELETSDARAEFAGFQEAVKGELEHPDQLIVKINAVTAQDVKDLAEEILVNKGLNMALIGRFGKEEKKDLTGMLSV